jgi:hypothetical protein
MAPSRTDFLVSPRTLRRRGPAPCADMVATIATTIITTTTGTTGVVRVLVRG